MFKVLIQSTIEGEETWVYLTDPDQNVLEFIQWLNKNAGDQEGS